MIIKSPELCTRLTIWRPKYSTKYSDEAEYIALLAVYKVNKATPTIIVDFTKAKHLEGQRYAISREVAKQCPIASNGTIDCYAVPLSKFTNWETAEEVAQIAKEMFDE